MLDGKGPGRKFSDFRSLHRPEEREKIRFVNSGGHLRNQLHRSCPRSPRSGAQLYASTNGHTPHLISHAGGRDVLSAIRDRLPEHELAEATEVLRQCGNLSSPSVMIALEKALARNGSAPDKLWITSSARVSPVTPARWSGSSASTSNVTPRVAGSSFAAAFGLGSTSNIQHPV